MGKPMIFRKDKTILRKIDGRYDSSVTKVCLGVDFSLSLVMS